MSLTTTAPLLLPQRQPSMSYPSERDFASSSNGSGGGQGPGPGAYYSRPPSSHGASSHSFTHPDASSPDRNGSSHSQGQGFSKSLPQTPVGYAQPPPPHGYPVTPISGPSYPVGSYYGISHSQSQDGHDHDSNAPSPPLSSGRGAPPNFTTDGNPIVPVGISGGKMFQCRGYGQCDKVFTRSEHLARHVRKHTGERPFPCHCGKSFSRLDNLRQHATTVHSNETQLNSNMLDSLTPVHTALSARATREQRKRGEIVEVPKNAVERPRHGLQRSSLEGSVPPSIVNAAYPPYADEGSGGWDEPSSRTRPGTAGAYDYHAGGDGVSVAGGLETTPGSSRRPGSSAGYVSAGYPGYYDGPSSRQPAVDAASGPKPMNPIDFHYRPVSSGGRSISHAQYADSEPPTSARGLPESPMYTAPPVPQPNWSSPPPHPAYGHEHRTFYQPAPTPEGYSYPETTHTPNPSSAHSYGPPPPGSAGSAYGYPTGAPPTPVNQNYFGPSQQYPTAIPSQAPGAQQTGYSVGAYTPGSAGSPFQYQAPSAHGPSSTPLTASTSLPTVSVSADYTYPPASSGALKRRLEEADDVNTTPVVVASSSQFNSRKVPRSSLALGSQPIRALQEHNPPGQDNDDQLWFPPTTERRSSLAISALLGSPQEDHKPRTPWDGGANGAGDAASESVAGQGGSKMDEKAKALLGSAH